MGPHAASRRARTPLADLGGPGMRHRTDRGEARVLYRAVRSVDQVNDRVCCTIG